MRAKVGSARQGLDIQLVTNDPFFSGTSLEPYNCLLPSCARPEITALYGMHSTIDPLLQVPVHNGIQYIDLVQVDPRQQPLSLLLTSFDLQSSES